MKIIFLDIDGVLNSEFDYTYFSQTEMRYDISERAIKLLNRLIDNTAAKIVISSTWRINKTIITLRKILQDAGFKYPESIISLTPVMTEIGMIRGNEILMWIKTNSKLVGDYHDFNSYIILDDDSDMLYWQKDNFIQTDRYIGLTPTICDRVAWKLNHYV